jgi:hypothetical protein
MDAGVSAMQFWTDLAAIVGVFITAWALYYTVKSFKQQLQLNFFAEYTKRYQEIILNFPESINEQDFRFDSLAADVRAKTLRYMRAYFDLCSEEYFLKRQGHIDDQTWKEWEMGMKFAFSKPAFQQAWAILNIDTIYYGEFSKFVNESVRGRT